MQLLNPPIETLSAAELSSIEDSPRLCDGEVRSLALRASHIFDVEFRIAWECEADTIDFRDGPIVITGGLARQEAMTLDGLSLILTHEVAHAKGTRCEAAADYWAARFGLRSLWCRAEGTGDETADGVSDGISDGVSDGISDGVSDEAATRRQLLAAYSALSSQYHESFDLTRTGAPIEIYPTGYPTLQSRWALFCAGFSNQPMPPIERRHPEESPELMNLSEAASYLGVSSAWFSQQTHLQDRPVALRLRDGQHYVKEDLDRFRTIQ